MTLSQLQHTLPYICQGCCKFAVTKAKTPASLQLLKPRQLHATLPCDASSVAYACRPTHGIVLGPCSEVEYATTAINGGICIHTKGLALEADAQ